MLEVADIFRLHGAVYLARCGDRLRAVQRQALHDIPACRTAYFGGHLKQCDRCGRRVYTYHSCGNRSCPKCHRHQTERWLEKQRARLLPGFYFLLTFTLPSELRPLARAYPKKLYGLLMSCAAAALLKLCRDPRYLGARPGCLAVLHTWTRAMLYHPHAHLLVTAGGLSPDRTQWIPSKNPQYLVPVEALSVIIQVASFASIEIPLMLIPGQLSAKTTISVGRGEGRVELDRSFRRVRTPYGTVRVKVGSLDGRVLHAWPEYEDCAAAARRRRVGLQEVQLAALAAYRAAPRRGPR